MKYKCGNYITKGGWGGEGIYLVSSIVKEYGDGRDVITVDGIIAGTGEGWNRDAVFNKELCQEIVRIANEVADPVL